MWKIINYKFTLFIIFITALCCHQKIYSQTQFSISANGGLSVTDGNYGHLFSGACAISFDQKYGIELGFTHFEFENGVQKNYTIDRYSLLARHTFHSNDGFFEFASKMGPSILSFKDLEGASSNLALDIGFETRFELFKSLFLNLGTIMTINKSTGIIAQLHTGFTYNFSNKRKSATNTKE